MGRHGTTGRVSTAPPKPSRWWSAVVGRRRPSSAVVGLLAMGAGAVGSASAKGQTDVALSSPDLNDNDRSRMRAYRYAEARYPLYFGLAIGLVPLLAGAALAVAGMARAVAGMARARKSMGKASRRLALRLACIVEDERTRRASGTRGSESPRADALVKKGLLVDATAKKELAAARIEAPGDRERAVRERVRGSQQGRRRPPRRRDCDQMADERPTRRVRAYPRAPRCLPVRPSSPRLPLEPPGFAPRCRGCSRSR